ncbi:MAG: type II and III secretion system protein family protein [Acetobacteraceae bacterium]|nr:type II and III secretion system protein family protein [Acetobacteraceae bacterium]
MRYQKVFRFLLLSTGLLAGTPVLGQDLPATSAGRSVVPARPSPVIVDAGSGRLIQLPGPAATILAADPRIARVQPASPTSIFIMGVTPGHTTVIATAENGAPIAEYDVTIRPGTGTVTESSGPRPAPSPGAIEGAIRRNLPGMGSVHVTAAGRNSFVLSGTVANASESQRAEAVARATAGDNREVINNLELLSATQVNVRVRVAEISRQITHELGFNWQALGRVGSFVLGLRTGGGALAAADAITSGALSTGSLATTASRFAAGVTTNRLDINSVVDALAADQLITILAEPNLTAQSGETASFLAGGEFPVPTGTSGNSNTITVEFKQFGVSLSFVPTVLGPNRLNLRIRPEVSQLSTTGAVSLPLAGGSVTIPALQVRRAETTLELGSGQSFAIGGLLQRTTTQVDNGILGLGDIPVLGALFRSDRFQRNETELVIIVTPYLVQPVSDPSRLSAPTDGFAPAVDLDRLVFRRQIARGAPMPQLRSRPDAGFILE